MAPGIQCNGLEQVQHQLQGNLQVQLALLQGEQNLQKGGSVLGHLVDMRDDDDYLLVPPGPVHLRITKLPAPRAMGGLDHIPDLPVQEKV